MSKKIVPLKVGDLVFAKVKGYAPWPARIEAVETKAGKIKYKVFFFGTRETGTVLDKDVHPYLENKDKLGKPGKKKLFEEGLRELEKELHDISTAGKSTDGFEKFRVPPASRSLKRKIVRTQISTASVKRKRTLEMTEQEPNKTNSTNIKPEDNDHQGSSEEAIIPGPSSSSMTAKEEGKDINNFAEELKRGNHITNVPIGSSSHKTAYKGKIKNSTGPYKVGNLVFTRVRGYPPWPSKIVSAAEKSGGFKYNVYFFGTKETALVAHKDIYPYIENKDKLGKSNKRKFFMEGISELESELHESNKFEPAASTSSEIINEDHQTRDKSPKKRAQQSVNIKNK